MRWLLIRLVLPFLFCLLPLLAAGVVAMAIPSAAMDYYLDHLHAMDFLIMSLGAGLFCTQMILCWKALGWRGTQFNQAPDRWITNLAQAAEWFPMLGLLGTVGGILQTFGGFEGKSPTPSEIISKYAPAITATGSGLFMAFINMLPPWMVMMGRDLITTIGGKPATPPGEVS